jgi:hypothetical protein
MDIKKITKQNFVHRVLGSCGCGAVLTHVHFQKIARLWDFYYSRSTDYGHPMKAKIKEI